MLAVVLVSANIAFLLQNKKMSSWYDQELSTFSKKIAISSDSIAKDKAITASLPETVDAAPTVEAEKLFGYINSGDKIVDNSKVYKAGNCDAVVRPWREITDSENCGYTLKNADGQMKVLIVQLLDPEMDKTKNKYDAFLGNVNSDKKLVYEWSTGPWVTEEFIQKNGSPTYNYLKDYFESEAKKFGNTTFSLQVDKTPVIEMDSTPLVKAGTYTDGTPYYHSKDLSVYLNELVNAKIDVRDYDAIVFGVMTDKWFNEYTTTSMRAGVVQLNPFSGAGFASARVGTVITHLFGATSSWPSCNTYDEFQPKDSKLSSLSCYSNNLNLNYDYRSVINSGAAKQMGWIK